MTMHDPDAPVRRLVSAVDMHAYSGRRTFQQVDFQRTLIDALDAAAAQSGLDRSAWYLQEQGDAEVAVLPADAPEPVVVADFVRELANRLARVNHSPDPAERLRLRVAIHSGMVHFGRNGLPGPAAVDACRLLDAPALKAALRDGDADLALILSDGLFHDVVSPGYRGLRAVDFTRVEVTVKEFTGVGHMRLLGGPGTRRGPARENSPAAARPSAEPGGTGHGTHLSIGAWSSGAGDAIGRDQINHGDRHVR
ncbi:hypothetical protein ACSNOI_40035 [Actinomadura kijaniata]|uniref:hypothetical protein n=1 Tax=Actinomadura kijaniata TaxID=46161 RepID=UPI003F1D34EE